MKDLQNWKYYLKHVEREETRKGKRRMTKKQEHGQTSLKYREPEYREPDILVIEHHQETEVEDEEDDVDEGKETERDRETSTLPIFYQSMDGKKRTKTIELLTDLPKLDRIRTRTPPLMRNWKAVNLIYLPRIEGEMPISNPSTVAVKEKRVRKFSLNREEHIFEQLLDVFQDYKSIKDTIDIKNKTAQSSSNTTTENIFNNPLVRHSTPESLDVVRISPVIVPKVSSAVAIATSSPRKTAESFWSMPDNLTIPQRRPLLKPLMNARQPPTRHSQFATQHPSGVNPEFHIFNRGYQSDLSAIGPHNDSHQVLTSTPLSTAVLYKNNEEAFQKLLKGIREPNPKTIGLYSETQKLLYHVSDECTDDKASL